MFADKFVQVKDTGRIDRGNLSTRELCLFVWQGSAQSLQNSNKAKHNPTTSWSCFHRATQPDRLLRLHKQPSPASIVDQQLQQRASAKTISMYFQSIEQCHSCVWCAQQSYYNLVHVSEQLAELMGFTARTIQVQRLDLRASYLQLFKKHSFFCRGRSSN